jgi:hypothetical protein
VLVLIKTVTQTGEFLLLLLLLSLMVLLMMTAAGFVIKGKSCV